MVPAVVLISFRILALSGLLTAAAVNSSEMSRDWLLGIFSQDLRRLDARHQQLIAELSRLPESAAVNTGSSLGWHSRAMPAADSESWAQVDLGEVWPIDAVALVAASGEAQGHQRGPGYGFPLRFRLELADEAEFRKPMVVYDTGAEDVPNPGGLPIMIETHDCRARYVRLRILKPWPRRDDWIVALGELMVLSGSRNVAARRPVRVSSSTPSLPEWSAENLTDGQSLLGPPVGMEPSPSNGYLARQETMANTAKWVQVDLGRACLLDEIRLFPARPTDFADAPGNGFPPHFRIEAANEVEFTDSRVVFDTGDRDFPPPGENPVMVRGDGKPARYVRVTALRLHDRGGTCSFALAELQVWSNGVNTAYATPVTALDSFDNPQYPRWKPEYLVDGFTSRQRILELPGWLLGLTRRREILLELDRIESDRRLAVDATLVQLAKSGVCLLVGIFMLVGGLLWRSRWVKRREVEALRARIAGDLHDEIGSQLGSIALAAQLAARRVERLDTARECFVEIERTARETNDAMHDIVWLLKPGSATLEELVVRLRETAVAQFRELDCRFEAEGMVPRLVGIEFTRHVYLLAKEAMANITKHAGASLIHIHVRQANGKLQFRIQDNGVGFDPATIRPGNGLDNMRRRAIQLGGTLLVRSMPGAGTTITLEAPIH